jgi:hypothetical protein
MLSCAATNGKSTGVGGGVSKKLNNDLEGIVIIVSFNNDEGFEKPDNEISRWWVVSKVVLFVTGR